MKCAYKNKNLASGSWLSPFTETSENGLAAVPVENMIPQPAAGVNRETPTIGDEITKQLTGKSPGSAEPPSLQKRAT